VTRRRRDENGAPGQDSFLDVVSNLVGILIILVMIVGARAKDAMRHVDPPALATPPIEAETPRQAALAARDELAALLESSQRQEIEVAYRRHERDRMLQVLAESQQVLDRELNQLDQHQRAAHELQVQLADARREHQSLQQKRAALARTETPVTVLTHRPTPMAKTVFGKEVHFRLLAGRLVYVPLDELVEMFQADARDKAWKLKQAPSITDRVGPYRGFHLQYTLKRTTFQLESRAGSVSVPRVELDHFVLIPTQEDLGETVERALQPDSEMRTILAAFDPRQATVTVWVYPDSFDQFRQIKEELYKLGFLTASRPLPDGQPITGAPQGTRSAAQ
jgi:hypothetical protein